MNTWTTRANTNSAIALSMILNRWKHRGTLGLSTVNLDLHQLSKSQEMRIKKILKPYGLGIIVERYENKIMVMFKYLERLEVVDFDSLPADVKFMERWSNRRDKVIPRLHQISSIPAGANPYCHDLISSGQGLPGGWEIMHRGSDVLKFICLVNKNTGERFLIDLIHIQTDESFKTKEGNA